VKTIHRYKVAASEKPQPIEMTEGARVVSVGARPRDPGSVSLWAEVDTEAETKTRWFLITGTGHPIPRCADTADGGERQLRFIGTVPLPEFGLVWHVWGVPWGASLV
jgi:hypothetical protein